MSSAETQAKREKKLEHFFREAYAVTFGNKKHEKSQVQFNPGFLDPSHFNRRIRIFRIRIHMKMHLNSKFQSRNSSTTLLFIESIL